VKTNAVKIILYGFGLLAAILISYYVRQSRVESLTKDLSGLPRVNSVRLPSGEWTNKPPTSQFE